MNTLHTFGKQERLTSKTNIERLFKQPTGSLFAYPVKFTWLITTIEEDTPAQILISVPKRNFKKAHDRNRIKRQIREVYRKNKATAYNCLTLNKQQACFLLGYVGKEHTQTHVLEQKIAWILKKFADAVAQNSA